MLGVNAAVTLGPKKWQRLVISQLYILKQQKHLTHIFVKITFMGVTDHFLAIFAGSTF
jgi:hypothetical protein